MLDIFTEWYFKILQQVLQNICLKQDFTIVHSKIEHLLDWYNYQINNMLSLTLGLL